MNDENEKYDKDFETIFLEQFFEEKKEDNFVVISSGEVFQRAFDKNFNK